MKLSILINMIGNTIKTKRLEKNYTQEYLAEVLGIDKSTYSRIESNQINPKKTYLLKLSNEFKCNLDDFEEAEKDITHGKVQTANSKNGLTHPSHSIPIEFADKMMARMERMHEHLTNLITPVQNVLI